jgi:predicted deacylase
MTRRLLVRMTSPVRGPFEIPYHDVGPGGDRPGAAFVAALHGDEINGTFILARLADFLGRVESGSCRGISLHRRVILVPAANVSGFNSRIRTWPFDGNDLNRVFPGNPSGETTQRIAWAVLEATKTAEYRVDLHSGSTDFEELPQVRLYDPAPGDRETARWFGLPAVMERTISSVFTATLMYAWRAWPGSSFLIQAGSAGAVQLHHCQRVFRALVAFLSRAGILSGAVLSEDEEDVHFFRKDRSVRVYAERAGVFVSDRKVGRWVDRGEELGYVYDGFDGNAHTRIDAPAAGLLTGLRRHPLLFEGDLVGRIDPKAGGGSDGSRSVPGASD